MTEKTTNQTTTVADRFVKNARDTQIPVSLYLVNGYQLKGDIIDFDQGSILFKHKNAYQLVMRSAVASMYPLQNSKKYQDNWWRNYTSTTGAETRY